MRLPNWTRIFAACADRIPPMPVALRRPPRTKPKSAGADFDFHIAESDRFQSRWQVHRVNRHKGVTEMKELHQERVHAVCPCKCAARPEHTVDLGKQPVAIPWKAHDEEP